MQQNRRKFLRLGSAAALAAIAGCSSGTGQENNGNGNGDSGNGNGNGDSGNGNGNGDSDNGNGGETVSFDGWLEDTGNFDGTVTDATGQSEVTVEVGASANGGAFGFAPPAIQIDTGTTVIWEWTGNGGGHNVVGENVDFRSGDPVSEGGNTFEKTFESDRTVKYFCNPHRASGMKGALVVGEGGMGEANGSSSAGYAWQDATWDSYWYSLFNMSTNIAMSGNGVTFPSNDQQRQAFQQRLPAMLEAAGDERPPVKNPNLNMLPFTTGDPSFTQQPVLSDADDRPDAATLQWDKSKSSGVVSPASTAWTHLKGVTWAKNFEKHFDILPDSLQAEFRSMVLTTLAQAGTGAALVQGGPQGNGLLTKGDSMALVSGVNPMQGEVVDETTRPRQHAAMLWFLSDMTSLAQGGWFGYENPEPLIPAENIQQLTDGTFMATMNAFDPADVVETESTRSLGLLLAALGWYGTHAGSEDAAGKAVDYANALADELEDHVEDSGLVTDGADNQAATQGIVGQGLLWAGELDGFDREGVAAEVLGYLFGSLWDEEAGTFASGTDDDVYTISARDAGDITGGVNAAETVLGMDVQDIYARFFNQTFNRGRLQRAERPQSRDESAEYTLPLPPAAEGEYGQAAVYNAEVEYDTGADEWTVTDDTFDTEGALYLANQDIWISQWGGDFFQGRGVPGQSDSLPN